MSSINVCSENDAETFEILNIDGQQYLYNKKDDTYQPIVIQTEENKENERQSIVDQNCKSINEEKTKVWTNELTLGLIALVEEYQDQFQNSVKKYVWVKISKILQDKFGFSITWQQCDTKWKGLLKMYKDIKEHNSKSGEGRKRWEYFEVMNKILHNKPEVTPVATCSSSKGLIINEELSSADESTKDESTDEQKSSVGEMDTASKSSFSRKRLKIINPVERRHQEKMQRQDKFLECFNDYVEVLKKKLKKDELKCAMCNVLSVV